MTAAELPGTVPPPPGPLAHPLQSSIYYAPDSVMGTARLAAELLADGRARTVPDLSAALPQTSAAIIRRMLASFTDARYLTARDRDPRRRSGSVRYYSLTAAGRAGLRAYLDSYQGQLEELDAALDSAGITRSRPGSLSSRPVPQLTPAGARILLHLYQDPELRDHLAPCSLKTIGEASAAATRMEHRRLRRIAGDLMKTGWIEQSPDPRPGQHEFTVRLTEPGRRAFPAAATRLRAQIAVMHRAADVITSPAAEAGR